MTGAARPGAEGTGSRAHEPSASPVVALDGIVTAPRSGDGVHWTLADGEDLNANLVHLDPGSEVGDHVNGELDVLVVVLAGEGTIEVEGRTHPVGVHDAILVPRGASRSIRAGVGGMTYLTVHRRRGGLVVGARRPRGGTDPRPA